MKPAALFFVYELNLYLNNINNTNNATTTSHFGFNEGTTAQDNSSRQLQRTEQLNTIDALTKHYKTEAEEEEARFKLEEERRRQEFVEKQKQRRQQDVVVVNLWL